MELPSLVIEPGRAIIGPAGVALYRIGAIKDVPGVRKFVSVDGGMGDNIRPALYQAEYEVVAANKADQEPVEQRPALLVRRSQQFRHERAVRPQLKPRKCEAGEPLGPQQLGAGVRCRLRGWKLALSTRGRGPQGRPPRHGEK